MRTCVGCRARCRDAELLRIVAVAGELVPDPRRRLPGRGAWLHPDPGCFATARKRRAFGRALRVRTELDVTPVRRYLGVDPGPDRSVPTAPGGTGESKETRSTHREHAVKLQQ